MSYRLDLDEYDEDTLRHELSRREAFQAKGLCDYCARKHGVEPSCKFPKRHNPSAHQCSSVRRGVECTRPTGHKGLHCHDPSKLAWGNPEPKHEKLLSSLL